ncbi:MAG: ATP synthase F1 subunit delta [Acidimicrobiales bacterium]
MRQAIRGYVDATAQRCAAEGSLSDVASQMQGVAALLGSSDDLRSVVADSGIPVASRRTVLEELLSGKVAATTMAMLRFVLDSERGPEVPEDIDWIAQHVAALSNRMEPTESSPLGFKAAEERVLGYATALLETVPGDAGLGEIEDELFRYRRIVGASEDLRVAMANQDLPAQARSGLVSDLLGAKATPATVALATYPVAVGRPRDYEELLDVLVERVAAEANRRVADVRSAVELDERQRVDLAAALSKVLGRSVDVRVEVDRSLIGGFVATVGDTVVDASIRRQLEILKERLAAPELNITTGERH